ncbi:ComEA family DNA-binding protein [Ferruginibacter sp. SUN106]|uniref:ComEA family DNA-binding protein n=1 Tax=Ferruginibacter sp. SUN106 TaxID=2978348 RepID=UPI003D364880
MWKQLLSSYFSFTKKERTGIFILLFLIIVFTLLPFLYPLFIKSKTVDSTVFEKEIATLKIKQQDTANQYVKKNFDEDNYPNYYQPAENNYNTKNKGELFYFDPNTATTADWQRLGVKDKTIAIIQNYVNKGGHFYKPEDISKIWGLHPDEVQRMIPYIQIAPKENTYPQKTYEAKTYDKPKNSPSIIDVNNADTSAFIALPGIGSKLAQRIINFRDKLGGFYKPEQVGETFGLPDSTFQKIKARLSISNSGIKQLNINTATVDELKAHPYIRYNIANAIVQYRAQHGNFSSVADIKNIMLVTEEVYSKAAPYLTVQ